MRISKMIFRAEYDRAIERWTNEQRNNYLAKIDRTWLAAGVRVEGAAELVLTLFLEQK